MGDLRRFADGLYYAEGPRWHEGRLWLSDFYAHAVFAYDADGGREQIASVPGQPSGLGWLPDGRLLVVSMLDRRLLRLDPDGLALHADLCDVASFHPNDMVVDAVGRAYVGNFGFDLEEWVAAHGLEAALGEPGAPTAAVARVDPDGTVSLAADGFRFPNGSVITPDGATLLVAETLGMRITAFSLASDGGLTDRRTWASTPGVLPDGIALDAEGGVWAASGGTPECVRVLEGGEITDRITLEQPCFACALGGADGHTLFVLTAPTFITAEVAKEPRGVVYATEVAVPAA